jgi:cytoskeleton protein RodZ
MNTEYEAEQSAGRTGIMEETNESLGSYLKRMRNENNVSIEQVAYATRISLKMLRALEEDDHTALPASTFVRGYLQAYAKYVRLDTQDLLLRYQHHLATAPDNKKGAIRSHYLYVRERYQEKRRMVLVIVLFATLLSVAGTFFLLKSKREDHKRIAQQAEQIQRAEKTAAAEAKSASDSGESKPEKGPEAAKKPEQPAPAPVAAAPRPATPPAPAVAAPAAPPAAAPAVAAAVPTPAPAGAPSPAAPVSPTPAAAVAAPAPTARAPDERKAYNLLLRAEEDVWLRFQTDSDEVRDLTLRSGRALMLRADSVIKIFSGNLGALKATMNGQPISSLTTENRSKSVVLPKSEVENHPLPLFPQNSSDSTDDTRSSHSAPQ